MRTPLALVTLACATVATAASAPPVRTEAPDLAVRAAQEKQLKLGGVVSHFVVQASRLQSGAGGTPAPQEAN